MPLIVSIIMSVYNGEHYLQEAIDSVLNQTFTGFEFIIINDGSTDKSSLILQGYNDPRIVLLNNSQRIGLAKSLNKGLAQARGKYMARMDADDVALPNRLEKQVAFLEKHPEVGIVGSQCWQINAGGQKLQLNQRPTSDLAIHWISLLTNPFIHPTVMIRSDIVTQHSLKYNETFETTQDYELWTRLLGFTQGANINEPLLLYRLTNEAITRRHRETQLKNQDNIALRTIQEKLPGFDITLEQVGQLRTLFVWDDKMPHVSEQQYVSLTGLYLDLFETFKQHYDMDESDVNILQRQEILKVIHFILKSPLKLGWLSIGKRLIMIDPHLILYVWVHLLKMITRRLIHYGPR